MKKNLSMLLGFASLTALALFSASDEVDASTKVLLNGSKHSYSVKKDVGVSELVDSLSSQGNNNINHNLNKKQKVDMEVFEKKFIGFSSEPNQPGVPIDVSQGYPIEGNFWPPVDAKKAVLKRTNDSVKVSIDTGGLEPGAYTFWWVIFGADPSETNSGWPLKAYRASNAIVNEDGRARIEAELKVGDTRETIAECPDDQLMANLIDATDEERQQALDDFVPPVVNELDMKREIWLIVKWHGPVSSDLNLYQQVTTVQGGCIRYSPRDYKFRPEVLGYAGSALCYDPQVAKFPAVE